MLRRAVRGNGDDRHMVGAGVDHGGDAVANDVDGPDRHHRVDEAVAARRLPVRRLESLERAQAAPPVAAAPSSQTDGLETV